MFRSKAFSVLQNIVNRSSCNIVNAIHRPLISTSAINGESSKDTEEALNVTSDENVDNAAQHPEITFDASSGTSNDIALPSEISNNCCASKRYLSSSQLKLTDLSEPDKLYKKLEIEVRGNDPAVLKSYGEFTIMAANNLDINIARHFAPRKAVHERETVLKAVHVQKKHRVQYETRTYYRYFDFFHLTGSTADTFLEYIQRNLPEGVAMKVTKVELQTLPETIEQAPLLEQ
ncbi:mitochondrial ribosomal protein S10 [Xylocopa sonorina]|uniref:mitochondrial ribosomal protein S10 n=1 Tax=Xylocopa sonorina TaxID=1818115 RepID=UPI00403B1BAE